MAVFRSFIYDDIKSLDKGVYITGEAVYNAPERDIEMVAIPGRNGDLAIDQGRYNNIEVSYPAGMYGPDQPDFAERLREFRNILTSRYRYLRLTDEYHPDEFRLALYKSGLEVSPAAYHQAGEFTITFECKPQRFLLSGEVPVDVYKHEYLTDHNLDPITDHNGNEIALESMSGEVTNPTPYECKPLIIAPSAGAVTLGGVGIEIAGDGSKDIYIDCDSMEIYTMEGEAMTSAADLVTFTPNIFPIMPPGENIFSSTIPDIQIIPRWWIL